VQIHASRGSPFGCGYCIWPQILYGDGRYRARDPMKVADELEMLHATYGFRAFYFDDDTFNIGKERILNLCAEIKRRGLHTVPWAATARADTLDLETLHAMKEAGLAVIKFGLDSTSWEIADLCGTGLQIEKVDQAIAWCRQIGLKFHLTFTFGLPGETKETIEQIIQYAIDRSPDFCQFFLPTPLPGTRQFRLLKEKGLLLTEEWEKYDGNRFTVMRGEHLSREELEQAVKDAYCRWAEFDRRRLTSAFPNGAASSGKMAARSPDCEQTNAQDGGKMTRATSFELPNSGFRFPILALNHGD
jgi:radical SAM superfamily enzyme YgiQ (UPF0313 family)